MLRREKPSRNKTVTTMRLPNDLLRQLERRAKAESRSRSNLVIELLRVGLKAKRSKYSK